LKREKLIALLASVALVLVLVLSGCAAPEAEVIEKTVEKTVTETVEVDKTYNVLNPKGDFIPVELQSMAPRLDTFEGKTIYVWQSEPDPIIMPALRERLIETYPNTNFPLLEVQGFGARDPEPEVLETADGVYRGIAW
jgi:hypothetical protein